MAHGDGEQADRQGAPGEDSGAPGSATPEGSQVPPPTGWPPAPQGWPPAPQAGWPPAHPAWPPAPQVWPTQPSQTPPPWQPAQPAWPSAADASSRPSRLPALLSFVAVALIAFSAGMVVDHLASPAAQEQAPLEDFDVYLEALEEVRQSYVDRDQLTDEQLLYGSIRGMVESLGDSNHTTFMTPEEYRALQNQLSGSVAGIGVLIVDDDGSFVVERVIRDSPAEEGGIKAGDRITAVDGESVVGLEFEGLAEKVRGEAGTRVTLTVIHSGSTEPVDLTLTRAEVTMPLVDWGMIPGTTIADIALYEFSSGAAVQVGEAVNKAKAAGATAIVLDLRGNPGGYAGEATEVLGKFLDGGVAYIQVEADGSRDEVEVDSKGGPTTLPLVVLVDGGTASASEVVAGCLQDRDRASVVGLNTVGTGTILLPFPLRDGSVILLGVTKFLTPSGNGIFGVGITPDVMVAMPQGAMPLDPFYFDTMTSAQFKEAGDAQLQKAIDMLSADGA